MSGYKTVASAQRLETERIKGSRFVAIVHPAETVEQCREMLADVRSELSDASHHCWAYRLREGGHRFSDDGEPGGSAGRPILQQIDGRSLTDLLVVVVRYFGGTKLGVGGLVRAYGGAAAAVLEAAGARTVIPVRVVVVEFPYDLSSEVQRVLAAIGLLPVERAYGERVRLRLEIPIDRLEDVAARLRDATGGRVTLPSGD